MYAASATPPPHPHRPKEIGSNVISNLPGIVKTVSSVMPAVKELKTMVTGSGVGGAKVLAGSTGGSKKLAGVLGKFA